MRPEMTNEQKMYFLWGYSRRSAELLKEEGLFKDLTIDELIQKLLEGATKK
ncbi:hypothetical protein [Bacillus cereus]|uniref:Uncharacterized protein n=1 Tax=Bacillus cereus VD184 TaxID=1053242 RepID=A0A9W5R0R6_BACCE|nr:hypothetical protein [Bacillus cereus]EOQ01004.1 hypothetical protein IKC_06202 [Bacillus cereus VD184]